MRFGADLINLGWKDSCLGAADYSRMSKLLPSRLEWVMYYWCFVDMYRTEIFTWVTVWGVIFESVFFFHVKTCTLRDVSRPALEITIPMLHPRSKQKQLFPPSKTSCKTWTISDGCVGSSYCQYNYISFIPTPDLPFFFFFWLGGF